MRREFKKELTTKVLNEEEVKVNRLKFYKKGDKFIIDKAIDVSITGEYKYEQLFSCEDINFAIYNLKVAMYEGSHVQLNFLKPILENKLKNDNIFSNKDIDTIAKSIIYLFLDMDNEDISCYHLKANNKNISLEEFLANSILAFMKNYNWSAQDLWNNEDDLFILDKIA